MLHHRHQLDVREAEPLAVLGQARRKLAVRQPPVVLLRRAHPRAEVHLVHGPWRIAPVRDRAFREPRLVVPVVRQVPHDRCLARGRLGEGRVRVRLLDTRSGHARVDEVLVHRPVLDARNESFPDARRLARLELVGGAIPAVEIAHHAHAVGVGRPHRERRAFAAQVGAELFVKVRVSALIEEVQIELRQQGVRDHAGASRSQTPRKGIRTQSGRMFNSYRNS